MLEAIAKYTLEWDMFPSLKNWDSFAYHAVLGYQALDKGNLIMPWASILAPGNGVYFLPVNGMPAIFDIGIYIYM